MDLLQLKSTIKETAANLGFAATMITDSNLSKYEARLKQWLDNGYHGNMEYMARHGSKRYIPHELVSFVKRVIVVRMDYLPSNHATLEVLNNSKLGFIARYTLGRDYHKVIRKKLHRLAGIINDIVPHQYRVFVDSAPVLEKPLAEKAGLGWIAKNTLLINSKAGSYFFLGVMYTNLLLPIDEPAKSSHCGSCSACIKVCPTDAIVAPYQLDARKCISYLTIENKGAIPIELRSKLGNRIFGCDDCQIVCPWNKFAKFTKEQDFHPRKNLVAPQLLELFNWTKEEFMFKTQGSAIRRAGYEGWLRNIAVALGNANFDVAILQALQNKLCTQISGMVAEHINWAIAMQRQKASN